MNEQGTVPKAAALGPWPSRPSAPKRETAPDKRYPNLFLVGAPKCGTTSMAHYLGQHPEVFSPRWKEPAYFGSDLTFLGRRLDEAGYLSLFQGWRSERYALDASTAYLCSQSAATEIRNCAEAPRILVMVRNPIEAAYSQYFQNLFDGCEFLGSFEDSFLIQNKRAEGQLLPRSGSLERLLYSRLFAYSRHIRRYQGVFGRDQVHIVVFDDFVADIGACFEGALAFLGLGPCEGITFEARNLAKKPRSRSLSRLVAGPPSWMKRFVRPLLPQDQRLKLRNMVVRLNTKPAGNPPITANTRRMLARHFAPEIERLSALLDRDLTHWIRNEGEAVQADAD